jgi:hypothetical protein
LLYRLQHSGATNFKNEIFWSDEQTLVSLHWLSMLARMNLSMHRWEGLQILCSSAAV